jgi:DNA-binding LytR/AlgR family response regulator
MPMKIVEEQLPASSFLRIHKSYIISIAFITAIRKSSVFVGTLELPVSDNYREAITLLTGKLPPPGRS